MFSVDRDSGYYESTRLYLIFSVSDAESVRPFQCSFCGNRFISESVLKAHITRNHSVDSQEAIENSKGKYYFHGIIKNDQTNNWIEQIIMPYGKFRIRM